MLQGADALGAITVYSDRPDAFDDQDAAVLAGLADQASIAIANVQLIAALERSREENAQRADAERTLENPLPAVGSLGTAPLTMSNRSTAGRGSPTMALAPTTDQ